MKSVEEVCQMTENYVKQLEALAYSKNAALATKLVGCIDTAILIANVSADDWNRRVGSALPMIMKEKVSVAKVEAILPDEISQSITLPMTTTEAKEVQVKLPTV